MDLALAVALAAAIDCGSSWSCFERAEAHAQPATVTRSVSSGSGSGTTALELRLTPISPSTATLGVSVASAPGQHETCTFQTPALEGLLEDVDTMGTVSIEAFVTADSCQGTLLPNFTQMKAKAALSPEEQAMPTGFENCGFSLGCLVRAGEQQHPAIAWNAVTFSLFGLDISAVSLLRTSDFGNGDVTLYVKTIKNDVTLDPSLIAQMRSQHMSSTQIAQAQARAEQNAHASVGNDGTCRFHVAALEALLRRWYEGNFSSDDWSTAESCHGKMFSGQQR